jgi:hypothetical protein
MSIRFENNAFDLRGVDAVDLDDRHRAAKAADNPDAVDLQAFLQRDAATIHSAVNRRIAGSNPT